MSVGINFIGGIGGIYQLDIYEPPGVYFSYNR